MAKFPNIEVGDLVTADLLNQMLTETITKTSAQSVTSSTVLVNDSELVITGVAGTFLIDLWIIYSAATNTTGMIKTSWTVTGTVTNSAQRQGLGDGITPTSGDAGTGTNAISYGTPFTTTIPYIGRSASLFCHLREWSRITFSTAWTVQIQWAQNSSNATATTVQANSSISAKREA